MMYYLVHALAKLGIFFRQEVSPYSHIAGSPATSAIIGSVDAAGRDGYEHPLTIDRVWKDGMKTQPATSRCPARPVWMIKKTPDQGPCFAGVIRFKQSGWLHPTV